MVEDYKRPLWTFNKLVYIEKEGFSEALKDNGWSRAPRLHADVVEGVLPPVPPAIWSTSWRSTTSR